MKLFLKYIGIGSAISLIAFFSVILVGTIFGKNTLVHDVFEKLFEIINKPLEFVPWLDFLAERQDPILSLALMAGYWMALGILISSLVFIVSIWSRQVAKGRIKSLT